MLGIGVDGFDIAYAARAATKRIMTISLSVGTRLPAYATSMGRVLLAALPDDRLDTYLDAATLTPLTERTIVDRNWPRANWRRPGSADGVRSTRNWKTACDP